MIGMPSNMSELERIRVLHDFKILDTPSEKEFDDLADIAAALCDAPIAFISLVDSERQWYKSAIGIDATESPRKNSFCDHAIRYTDEVMVIPDSLKDDRFKTNPMVLGEPYIRFYAGAPLLAKDNIPIGTLCVLDRKPKKLSKDQKEMLAILARKVVDSMELRRRNLKQKRKIREIRGELNVTLNRFIEAQQVARIGSWDWDLTLNKIYWSPEMYELFGLKESEEGTSLSEWENVVHPDDLESVKEVIRAGFRKEKMEPVQYRLRTSDKEVWVSALGKTVITDEGEVVRMYGTVQDITDIKKAEVDKMLFSKTLQDMLFDLSHKLRQPLTNCLALVHIFNNHDLTGKKIKEFANYLHVSVEKMDEYLREVSDYVYENKQKIK